MPARFYQSKAIASVLLAWEECQRVLLCSPTGSGKNYMGASIIKSVLPSRCLFLGDQTELVFQPADAIANFAGIVPAIEKAQRHAPLNSRVVVASVQSMSRSKTLQRYPSDFFSYILADECFPSTVQVDGKSISEIRVGDRVSSLNPDSMAIEQCRVVKVYKSVPSGLGRVRFTSGGNVDCTPNHPFYTSRGWVSFCDLRVGDSVVRSQSAYQKVYSMRQGNVGGLSLSASKQNILLKGLQDAANNGGSLLRVQSEFYATKDAVSFLQEGREDCLLPHLPRRNALEAEKDLQSDARQSRGAREAARHHETHGPQADYTRRKWETVAASSSRNGVGDELAHGSRHRNQDGREERLPVLLQAGYCEQEFETGTGDRRQLTQAARTTSPGQEEGCILCWDRVDDIEIFQRTSDGEFGGMCPGGFTYNLEVEGNHTYFANGIAVHNCHRHVQSKQRVFEYFKGAKVCGMSATPFRATMKDLSKWYEETAFSLPILDLMAQGFAPPWKIVTPEIEIDLANVEVKKGPEGKDYDLESLTTTIEPQYQHIAETVKPFFKGHHGIVFLPLIKSSQAFAAIARRAGITAIHVDGKSENRDEILTAFRMGRYEMLCNANLIETGVDIPIADVFLNLRLTRSRVKYNQSVGRVLRVLPGVIDHLPGENQADERKAAIAASAKPKALVLNLLLQHDELGVCGPESLIARTPEEELGIAELIKKQRTPEQLEAIAKRYQDEKESKLIERLEEVSIRRRSLHPDAAAVLLGSRPLINYQPYQKWHFDDPSEKQLAALEKWGISREGIDTKGYASLLMDNLVTRATHKLARIHTLKRLTERKITFDVKTLTEATAKELLGRFQKTY